ncbi:type II CAAX prenyl endopeptidase Rce1 family protein [Arenimonas sp.]|uniref:CPBP family glutamic-type intramembrane protease n=1 Tax=Arenimonas sp. TaxID=1872635 RepID=UPI0039E34A19
MGAAMQAWPIYLGVLLVWALFHGSASLLGSMRGEAGWAVLILVVGALLLVERWLHGRPARDAWRALGFGRPSWRAICAALFVLVLVGAGFAFIVRQCGVGLRLIDAWPWLALGMFLQGGLAEETLFRGYLYRHYRERHAFWPAALRSLLPFVLVHLLLFLTLPFAIAAASLGLSIVTTFPLAKLFDAGGGTVWAPALLHAGVQGIKLFELPAVEGVPLAVWWMLLFATLPWLVFLPVFDSTGTRENA